MLWFRESSTVREILGAGLSGSRPWYDFYFRASGVDNKAAANAARRKHSVRNVSDLVADYQVTVVQSPEGSSEGYGAVFVRLLQARISGQMYSFVAVLYEGAEHTFGRCGFLRKEQMQNKFQLHEQFICTLKRWVPFATSSTTTQDEPGAADGSKEHSTAARASEFSAQRRVESSTTAKFS